MTEHLGEQRISSRRVYSGRVVKLDVDSVRLPNGGDTMREVVRHPGAAVMLARHDDGVVFVRQFRYAAGETLFELPAGTLEPGEEPLSCARRELAEETGWCAAQWRELGSFFTTPGFTDELIHAFFATGLSHDEEGAAQDDDEVCETVILAMEELRAMLLSGEIRDAKTLATLQLAALRGWLE